ncbi:hypothetical protein GCM10017567_01210 [Amycolatopsis bullii]|uniref:Uncharacterized protein n=1 Tax=Amycolatopsis bullii TaxID=941987 RepID=A0ABQ3JVB0_9PSEU|nr:hypothetical protein GCM10017567_01210 [Amycolatopsis bullii]
MAAAGGGPQWLDVVSGEVWWAEGRPGEQGRVALVRAVPGGTEDVLPAPWNVRNRLHEYGGRPWAVADGVVVFTHWSDQRVYAQSEIGVVPLTPSPAQPQSVRYGDLRAGRPGEVWAVRERSTGPRPTDIERELVAIAVDGGGERVLAASHRFLTVPKLSPDGRHAAWFGWDHPRMPWDGTELCVAPVDGAGAFGPHRVVAGGVDVSVCQVEWETPEALLALADPDGWWNLHRIGLDGSVVNLAPVDQELGGPLWKAGSRWFAPLGGGRHAVLAGGRLAVLDQADGSVTPVDGELTAWSSTGFAVLGAAVVGVAGGPARESAVVRVALDGTVTDLTPQPELPSAFLPVPQERVFTTADGETVPVVLYPPRTRISRLPTASGRPCWCTSTVAPPGSTSPSWTWRSRTSPAAASASRRSTTAGRRGSGAPTGSGCGSSGAWWTSPTAWRWPRRWWRPGWPTVTGWASAAAARAGSPRRRR